MKDNPMIRLLSQMTPKEREGICNSIAICVVLFFGGVFSLVAWQIHLNSQLKIQELEQSRPQILPPKNPPEEYTSGA